MHAYEHAAADHPAGMKLGEIFLLKAACLQQHHCQRITSANITVVLEVGARFSGQASCSMFTLRQRCAFCARTDFGSPHMAMIFTWNRAMAGRILSNSSVSPLALKAST